MTRSTLYPVDGDFSSQERNSTMIKQTEIKQTDTPPPLKHSVIAKRRRLVAEGKPQRATVSLLDVSLAGVRAPRVVRRDGRLRLIAQVAGDGLRRERRYDRIPVTALRPRLVDPRFAMQDITGHRPTGVPTTFIPRL